MVLIAVLVMTLAVALGTGLGLWHLRVAEGAAPPPLSVGVAHGFIGATGLLFLLFALGGPPRGVAAGAGRFGQIAAVLFAAALAAGLIILALRRRRPAVTTAIHAGLAITGYLLLLAWNWLG